MKDNCNFIRVPSTFLLRPRRAIFLLVLEQANSDQPTLPARLGDV